MEHRMGREGSPPRIACFTHDTFGLGHVRRSLHVLRALAASEPEAALLLITGSPALGALGRLPNQADVVKIPTVARTGAPESRPPHLRLPVSEVTALRQRLVREAVRTFRPDVFLVDNFPLGSRRELLPVLEELRDGPTRCVLGLRDVVDLPETVRERWAREGIYDVLEALYDRILVYGPREVLDVAEAYRLSDRVAAKVRYCGYVTDVAIPAAAVNPPDPHSGTGPRLLATVGGGGDGLPLLRAFLGALPAVDGASALVVTGPLMPAADRDELRALAARCDRAELRDAVDDLPVEMARADLVVGMAGYNTVAEILALRRRAVLVPRTWRYGEHLMGTSAGFEGEQLLRARALERAGLAEMLDPGDLTPAAMAKKIRLALRRPEAVAAQPFDLGGLRQVREEILNLACAEPAGHARVA
jgi:predicted glycosyltransferase